MIKFFRRIRQNLITENKAGKTTSSAGSYMLYAIGEIVLVVIGILIALSINNWNESNQKEKDLKNIYAVVADDLRKDSSEVAMVLNFMSERKKLFDKILNDSLTLKDIDESEIVLSILNDIRILNIERRGYNLLRNFENNSVEENDSLAFQIINFYANSIFYSEKIETMIIDDLIKTNDRWKSRDWYAKIMINKIDDNYIDYMLTDNEYKNLCAFRYTLYYDNYQQTLEKFQKGSLKILDLIETELGADK
jgi:hypothetical protein